MNHISLKAATCKKRRAISWTASFFRVLYHTQLDTHKHTLGRTPLSELFTLSQRSLPTQHTTHQQTNIHSLSAIQTRDPRNQAVENLRLGRQGHRDRQINKSLSIIIATCCFTVELLLLSIDCIDCYRLMSVWVRLPFMDLVKISIKIKGCITYRK